MPTTFADAEEWAKTPIGSLLQAPDMHMQPWRPRNVLDKSQAFHTEARLPEGEGRGLIVDPGSMGNLGSDDFAREEASKITTSDFSRFFQAALLHSFPRFGHVLV